MQGKNKIGVGSHGFKNIIYNLLIFGLISSIFAVIGFCEVTAECTTTQVIDDNYNASEMEISYGILVYLSQELSPILRAVEMVEITPEDMMIRRCGP